MTNCQHCGKPLEPKRKLQNDVFRIEAYCCDECGEEFKVTH